MVDKIRVGFVTSNILAKTGFSNNARALLPYLWKTGKYEIFHLVQSTGDDPNLQRFPWVSEGCLKPQYIDGQRWNNDEGYRRFCSYANPAVEDFILKNKIEVLILQEDGWAFEIPVYLNSKWFPYIKDNVLLHTTIDSLNILPTYKEWAERCPNFWCWASFAERALKKENPDKYKNVKTVYACMDVENYNPTPLDKKNELRKRNNIDLDTVMFFHLGRSQLRKLYPFTIEAFAKFKKRYPNYKAKLAIHCFWGEGWALERLIQDNGLEKSDVLTTYFCLNCKAWEIKPYEGEYKDCRFCGIKGQNPNPNCQGGAGQKTAGVDSTITNREISDIYGMMDASISLFTSGGFELHNAQSLLCSLPLLCSNYSCGEDFCAQSFVFPSDGTFTYECGTNFLKHVPNIETVVKYYKTICDMSLEERQEIGRKGRKWALEQFRVDTIGPIFEKWIDSRKRIEWDYKYPEDIKNPNAQIPNIQDNSEWLVKLYKDILNMDVLADKDDGHRYWMQELSKGAPREKIENYFRGIAAQENAKRQIVPFESLLDANDAEKRIIIVQPESIGDVILVSSVLPSIKEQYPDYNIYFATKPENFDVLEGNPYIFKILQYHPQMDSQPWLLGCGDHKGYFQHAFMPFASTQKFLSYLSNEPTKFAFEIKEASCIS